MLEFLQRLKFPLPQASTFAPKVDLLYDFIFYSSVFLFIPTIVAMIYFGWKYRTKPNDNREVPYIDGHHTFEWFISAFVGVIFFIIFVWGLIGFNELHNPPAGTYEIGVVGKQWMWEFNYSNGKTTRNELYLPKGIPVKLVMSSPDVLHSFYVVNFRVKQDVVPGMYTTLWFQADQLGEHDIFCAEYCGTAHSNMLAKAIVLEPEQFKAWLQGSDPNQLTQLEIGKKIFNTRNCVACHSVTGVQTQAGPTVKGLFNRKVNLSDGTQVVANEDYIRTSIINPATHVVKGFRPIMPAFQGLLSENDISAVIAYIKSLKE
ncbi:MAG: cytochrome c oxidase subunit II [Oligoflexia bacterium]|nr:cytochrome c oxidase subunit II [Oligoflexia bacterium]